MNGRRFTFSPRTLLWLFPQQEHQLVARSDDARFYVVVFKPSLIRRSCHAAAYEGLKHKPKDEDNILSTVLDPKAFDLVSRIMDSLMQGAMDSDVLNREAGFGPASDFHFEHHDPDALNAGLHYLLLVVLGLPDQRKHNAQCGRTASRRTSSTEAPERRQFRRRFRQARQNLRREQIVSEQNVPSANRRCAQ